MINVKLSVRQIKNLIATVRDSEEKEALVAALKRHQEKLAMARAFVNAHDHEE